MSEETQTQITMRKVREEWEAPLRARIATLEARLSEAIELLDDVSMGFKGQGAIDAFKYRERLYRDAALEQP